MRKAAFLGLLLTIAGTLVAADDSFEPNYANHMLTPYKGSGVAPRLIATRHHFPLKVIVLEDRPYFSESNFDAVKDACAAWAAATKNVPQGGVTYDCMASDNPVGADVVFKFGPVIGASEYEGFTSEFGSWALVQLAVVNVANVPVPQAKLKRVAMHEFGHALGIWGHSPNPKDIMSLDEDTSTITTADVNTLLIAYSYETSATQDVGLGME